MFVADLTFEDWWEKAQTLLGEGSAHDVALSAWKDSGIVHRDSERIRWMKACYQMVSDYCDKARQYLDKDNLAGSRDNHSRARAIQALMEAMGSTDAETD